MEQHNCLVWTDEMQRFVRNLQMPVAASVVDVGHASRVVWPDAQGIVALRRLDVFDATSPPPRLRLVMDPEKSAQLKHKSLEWRYRQSAGICGKSERFQPIRSAMKRCAALRSASQHCFSEAV